MNANDLNAMTSEDARNALTRCCGSARWVDLMLARRPFASSAEVLAAADAVDAALTRDDWLAAFAAHPRIGDIDTLKKKFATTAALCEGEQAGVAAANDDTLRQLAKGNTDYEARFGHIFIVCATGKSADEMLAILQARLPNDPETELRIAAGEQAKITRIRLEK